MRELALPSEMNKKIMSILELQMKTLRHSQIRNTKKHETSEIMRNDGKNKKFKDHHIEIQ